MKPMQLARATEMLAPAHEFDRAGMVITGVVTGLLAAGWVTTGAVLPPLPLPLPLLPLPLPPAAAMAAPPDIKSTKAAVVEKVLNFMSKYPNNSK